MLRLSALVLLAATATACVWDRDTIRDETRNLPLVFDLITGQFEHHGSGYYEARLADCKRVLGTDNVDVQVRNDMGVALLKLSRYDESLAVFRKLESEDPKRYETLSNLGVLFKKMGRFQEAADYTAKALEIKPEGHLGMRDFYVKMLRWRAELAAAPEAVPAADFLGRAYSESSRGSGKVTDEELEHLLSLIRSDKTFVDAYFVLGDHLHHRGHLNLAFWSWARALQLGHPAKSLLYSRLNATYAHWELESRHRHGQLAHKDASEAILAVTKELENAAAWQKTFEAVEGEMVVANPNVQFEDVSAELVKRGVARVKPTEHGLRNSMQEEVAAQEEAARAAAERKVQAAAEKKAKAAEAKRARDEAHAKKSQRSMWMLGGGAFGAVLLAAGVMLIRKN